MRTTVTLDPDTHALVQKLMEEKGLTFKEAVNRAIREGLTSQRRRFRQRTHKMGPPRVDLTKALQLAGQLEDEEILRKMALGK